MLVDRAGEAVRDLRRPRFPVDAMPLPGDMLADQPDRYPLGLWPMKAGSVRDHERLVPVTRYEVRRGWCSATAPGLAVSVVLRGYGTTDERSCPDGREPVKVKLRPPAAGGCSHDDQLGRPFLDECPSESINHIFNDAVFALFGLFELSRHQGVGVHPHAADRLRDSLAEFDRGYWTTRYDLQYHSPARLAYHRLHTALLTAAGSGLAEPRWLVVAAWNRYPRNPAGRLRAAAGKGWFVLRERRAGS
ncbi:D-glucuronyl C5-epimerase family protein [Streptomyces sp. B4I13]|uniref:D-glucuronyl C5-epimerase family protein n=1 Tax=Streptomyces sp. B4I13 TaxID=3042271 RepID=UPI0027D8A573|nr:D-glucuronyl C5-epimerase family protein [Streptomyces sp. B4I13]